MAVRELTDDQRTIPVDKLLAPIPGESPGGVDLRADSSPSSLYYKLKDARSAARTAERRAAEEALDEQEASGVPTGVLPMVPQWRVLLDEAPATLAEESKDLEVAAWLTEALVRAHGIAGVRDGLRLTAGLVRDYWNVLFPSAEDGVEDRVSPMLNLNGASGDGALVQAIRNVPITAGGEAQFAQWHFRAAHQGSGIVTIDQFQASAAATPPDFYAALAQDVEDAVAELALCDAAFVEKCGGDAPPVSAIRAALEEIREVLGAVAPGVFASTTDAPAVAAAAPGASPAEAGAGAGGGPGELRTREDAFRMLLVLSDFFRRTEPHSPISYTLEELVRRGRMPLAQLLEQLLPDEDTRRTFLVRAGINPPEPPS